MDDPDSVFLACLGWGKRKRVSYAICLSRAISVRVFVDVLVVPTSWWIDDCEGTWSVVQMRSLQGWSPPLVCTYGSEVVGWVRKEETDEGA